MGHKKKVYRGSIATEEEAAKIYDEFAIKTHGYKVSNFTRVILYYFRPKPILITQKTTLYLY